MLGSVLFLIPARGGSKGLPGKNVRELAGLPLLAWSVRAAKQAVQRLGIVESEIVCSTDDEGIAAVAVEWGAEVPFVRPQALSTDTAGSVDVALHALDWYSARGRSFDLLVLLQPTSPLRSHEDIVEAVQRLTAAGASSAASVSQGHPPEWTYRLSGERLSPGVEGQPEVKRRQDRGDCYGLNGAVYVVRPEQLRTQRRFVSPGETLGQVMPSSRGLDVDTLDDFRACEAVLDAGRDAVIKIGGRVIGSANPCFVIAEAGVNHNGDVDLAHALVDAAADAGADAVKFQTFNPATLAADGAPKAGYQEETDDASDQRSMLERLVLDHEAWTALKRHAEQRGLLFLSSPFDEQSADMLHGLGIAAFKIPSGELTNHRYLAHIAAMGRPILMSTGMSTMREVVEAVDVIREAGSPPLALFHCVSNYPADPEHSNLRAMDTLRRCFGVPVGWSDHTVGNDVSLAAVAMGAQLLERHLTLDKTMTGPDHRASLEPLELKSLVEGARMLLAARGDGRKRPFPPELEIARVARKSLHYKASLPAGHELSSTDLVALRPGTGVPASAWAEVAGRSLRRRVAAGEMLDIADLEALE